MSALPLLTAHRSRQPVRQQVHSWSGATSQAAARRVIDDDKVVEVFLLTIEVRARLLDLGTLAGLTASCVIRINESSLRARSSRQQGKWHSTASALDGLYRALGSGIALLQPAVATPLEHELFLLRRTIGRL